MTVSAKICGITDSTSMKSAVLHGASFVGLVFYSPSPRHVELELARRLFSIVPESKIANQISDDLNISLSAVYKTLGKLEELTLVFVEKFEFRDGKKIKFYKSRVGNAEIELHTDDAVLRLYPNKAAIDT